MEQQTKVQITAQKDSMRSQNKLCGGAFEAMFWTDKMRAKAFEGPFVHVESMTAGICGGRWRGPMTWRQQKDLGLEENF